MLMETVLFRTKPTKLQLLVDLQGGLATAVSVWTELKKRKSPRGNPKTGGYTKRLLKQSEKRQLKEMQKRTRPALVERSINELEALAEYMPNLTDSDVKVLALSMYYLELSTGMSSASTAQ